MGAFRTTAWGFAAAIAAAAGVGILMGYAGAEQEAEEQAALAFEEWPVPWENTRPRDPYVAPDGGIWFVGQQGDYAARLDPETGEMERFDLPEGAGPHTVIVDADGYPWYAGNRDRHIGRIDPATGEITRYDLPEGINDPHTMAWTSEGEIWFTVQRSGAAGYVGLFSPQTGDAEIIEVPGQGMRPYGIVTDDDDRPWIAFMGANAIGTVNPETMELEVIETPHEGSQIRRLDLTSDGRVWWVDASEGYMGVYDPADQSMRQWETPAGNGASLYATAVDGQDRLWYVEAGPNPNRFVGFDTNTEEFLSINEVPSGGGSVRHMVYHEPDNVIWFGTDTHTVGRAIVPE